MKRLAFLVALAATLVLAVVAAAAPPPVDARRVPRRRTPAPARSWPRSDAHERLPIASITKLMTVLVALEHATLDDVVTVDPARGRGRRVDDQPRAGERLTVRDLVEAALIQSANDAADALAAYVGHGIEPRFVALMNAKARGSSA